MEGTTKKKQKMKKLLIIAAVALSAAASQAASVNWSLNNIQSSPDTAVGAGWLVQVYDASTAFSFDAAKEGSITALASGSSIASGTIFKASGTFGDYAAGAAVNTYAVVFDAGTVADAKNYIVSDVVNKNIAASGANLNLAFGNMASTATSNAFHASTWTAVPEPTSGLLLLLGMAGLALKRKRA